MISEYAFSAIEVELYRPGREAFLEVIAKIIEHDLRRHGARGVITYSCRRWDRDYEMIGECGE